MTNRNHYDHHHLVLDATQNPPIAHSISPKPVPMAAERFPEPRRVYTPPDTGFEKLLHFARN